LLASLAHGPSATGLALSYGLGTVVGGGTAPLPRSVLSARGTATGVAVYLILMSAAGLVAVALAPARAD
jgi:hypothetical protein